MVSLFKRMRFVFIYQLLWKTNLKMWKVHMHKTPYLEGIVGVIVHKLGFLHLLKKGGISQLDRQIMKALGSEGVNVKEFLVDIFKSKMKSSYALPYKQMNLPLLKRQLIHQTTKSECTP